MTQETKQSKSPENAGSLQEIERDEKGRFVEGKSGNPLGKIVGTKNFDTIFREAIEKLAKDDPEFVKAVGKDLDGVDRKLVRRAIIEAAAGNFSFYKDIYDRRFGDKSKEPSLQLNNILVQINNILDESES